MSDARSAERASDDAHFALRPTKPTWTHIALRVSDIDASIAWYQEFTPLELLEKRQDDMGFGAWLGEPDSAARPFILVLAQFLPETDPYREFPMEVLTPFAHLGVELPTREALDDAAAAKLLRAAHAESRLLIRVTVEVLLRTGLRVSEFTALRADAVVQIGAAPWLHVPVGKLREDRYLPLHPQLVQLIGGYRAAHVPDGHPLLLPRENGRALDRHTVTRFLNKAGAAAGLPHIHPHQMRHTLATQAINRGMSLEAIAAMLGHRSMDMTLRYAKIANRTVADEYFAVTDQVDALYGQSRPLPGDAIGPKMARLRREHHRLLGNGHCTRPAELDCAFESICENCSFFQTSIEFRPTLQAQHDDAEAKGHGTCQPF